MSLSKLLVTRRVKKVQLYTDTDGDGRACELLLAEECNVLGILVDTKHPKCRTNVDAPLYPTVVMTDWVPNDLDKFLEDNPHVERCIVVDHHPWDDATRTSPKIVKFWNTSMCAAQILYKALGFNNPYLWKFVQHIGYHDLFTAPSGCPLPEADIRLRATVHKCGGTVRWATGEYGTVEKFFSSLHEGYFRNLTKAIEQVRENDAFVAQLMNTQYVREGEFHWSFDAVSYRKDFPNKQWEYSAVMSLLGYQLSKKYGKPGFFLNMKTFKDGDVYGLGFRSSPHCEMTAKELMAHMLVFSADEPTASGAEKTAGGHEHACGMNGYTKGAYDNWKAF